MVDGLGVTLPHAAAQPSTTQGELMADTPPLGATVRCAVPECAAVATGYYTLNDDTVVIHVGRAKSENEVPLCTLHTWNLSRDMVDDQP